MEDEVQLRTVGVEELDWAFLSPNEHRPRQRQYQLRLVSSSTSVFLRPVILPAVEARPC